MAKIKRGFQYKKKPATTKPKILDQQNSEPTIFADGAGSGTGSNFFDRFTLEEASVQKVKPSENKWSKIAKFLNEYWIIITAGIVILGVGGYFTNVHLKLSNLENNGKVIEGNISTMSVTVSEIEQNQSIANRDITYLTEAVNENKYDIKKNMDTLQRVQIKQAENGTKKLN
jgi:uncharacterized membrane protein